MGIRLAVRNRVKAASGFAAVAGAFIAGASPAATVEEIQACLAANAPRQSSALQISLRSRRRDGPESKHRGRIFWRRSPEGFSESLICLYDPPTTRGLAYLVSESDSGVNLWGYLPSEHRVVQIRARGAARRARIARTAIGYDDLRYLPLNLSRALAGETREASIGNRVVTRVELSLPRGEDVAYERVVTLVDEQTCVPLQTEFFGSEERLLKRVTVDPESLEQVRGTWLARSLEIEDRRNEVRTELRIEKIELEAELPDGLFVPTQLRRNPCL